MKQQHRFKDGKNEKEREKPNKKTVVEDELAEPDQIDDMLALRDTSASASASSSGHISDTGIVPIRPRSQSYEDQTSRNLRGSIETPRWGGHRRTQSASTVASATAAAAEEDPEVAKIRMSTDIDVLLEAAKHRRSEFIIRDAVADHQLVMEMRSVAAGIEKLRPGGSASKTQKASDKNITLITRLIEILNTPL